MAPADKSARHNSASTGWRSFVSPDSHGKSPWKLRWLGVPLILAACTLGGWWAWGEAESQLDERARVHLACEGINTSELDLDWSYRSVEVRGELPPGVSADLVEDVIDNGSSDASCLASAGIDGSLDTGVVNVVVLAAAAAPLVVPDGALASPTPGAAEPAAAPDTAATPTAVPPTTEPEPAPEATAVPEPSPEPTATLATAAAALAATVAFDGQVVTLQGAVAGQESGTVEILDAATPAFTG